ncbi:MAG TPA: GAF domain-containing sensor histidine kinase [Woeseiaceae bacterium]|nr:GAF domain-containing sensor histidine kinase [Woeseiaceae bacterium]
MAGSIPDDVPSRFLDRLAHIACQALQVPVALVSVARDENLRFTGQCGLADPFASAREMPADRSLCRYVISTGEPLVVADARSEPSVAAPDIPGLDIVAYAGMPLMLDGDGTTFGSFCAIDTRPREWTARELRILRDLAAAAGEEITMRQRAFRAERLDAELRDVIAVLERNYSESVRVVRDIEHDIRTPLGTIALAVQTLRMHTDPRASAGVIELLQVLARSVDHAAELAQNLGTSASGRHRAALVDLAALADDVCAAARKLRPQLSIEREGTETAVVLGERGELRRCVENLLSNAERFAATRIVVRLAVDDGFARFEVHDDGPGLPRPEDYAHAWKRAAGLHRDVGKSGSGLGLSIVHSIVARHDGEVIGEPSPLGGAAFGFDLPLPAPAEGQA